MKSFFKFSIIALCLLHSVCLFAQDRNSRIISQSVTLLRQDSSNYESQQKAWSVLNMYANQDSVRAMCALGMFYQRGIEALNIRPDHYLSRTWYEKAVAHNCTQSAHRLSVLYHYSGQGVEQNFETSLFYAKKAAESGNPQMLYNVSYFYYTGFGCEQSYPEAIRYFEAAAAKQHRGAMYMLGLCYRNGYGVERDTAIGNSWLEKAKLLGHPLADTERMDSPERPLDVLPMEKLPTAARTTKRKSEPQEQVRHSITASTNIEGNYTGALITYDWSGKYPLTENFLDVTFEQSGCDILVKWIEEDATEVEATATLTDSGLVFHEAVYYKTVKDHFSRKKNDDLSFKKATLQYINENGQVLLSGNLQLYSRRTKEPGKPMYLILQPKQNNTIKDPVFDAENEDDRRIFATNVLVYPNPFADHLNLSFALEEKSNCEIYIYSVPGTLVYQQRLGTLEQGVHRYQLNTSSYASGSYIVRLLCGDQSYTLIIIK